MSRDTFLIVMVALAAIILIGMWLAWRARSRRDAGVITSQSVPKGAVVAEFPHTFYVSTNAVGDPLTRVAVPSMRYRGYADVTVFEDGVTLEVQGESPVHFAANQLRGSGIAARRPGKAVERGGLALMKWNTAGRDLESSFRFEDTDMQQRFMNAIDQISGPSEASSQPEDNERGTR